MGARVPPGARSRPRDAGRLASAYQDRSARGIEVGLGEIHCLTDPQSRPPHHHDQRSQPSAIGTASAHHGDDFLDGRRLGTVGLYFSEYGPS
jgi:hypothetical protein